MICVRCITKEILKNKNKNSLSLLLANNTIYSLIVKYNYSMNMIRYGDAAERAHQERRKCAI